MPLRKNEPIPLAAFQAKLEQLIKVAGGNNKLAIKAGVSPSTVSTLRKTGNPTLSVLMNLARAGNVTIQWLLSGEDALSANEGQREIREVVFHEKSGKSRPQWTKGEVLAVIDNAKLAAKLRTPDPSNLLFFQVSDQKLWPLFYYGEYLVIDGNQTTPGNGHYVVIIQGRIHCGLLEHDKRKQIAVKTGNGAAGYATYSKKAFKKQVEIVGRILVALRWTDIDPGSTSIGAR